LVEPGKPVCLTEFYRRVFAHYGIALGDKAISTALLAENNSFEKKNYVVTPDTAWIEEALKQGGLLIELSDSISIVRNPDHLEI
jgi:PIN domain nuclease of toxin-antitoxin system